jgi:hypothetical protein
LISGTDGSNADSGIVISFFLIRKNTNNISKKNKKRATTIDTVEVPGVGSNVLSFTSTEIARELLKDIYIF